MRCASVAFAPRRVMAALVSRAFHVPLAIGALLSAGCQSAPTVPSENEGLVLDVQVHLLRSVESDALTTTLAEQGIEQIFGEVNEVWSQAGIEWRVASVLHEEVEIGKGFDAALRRREAAISEMVVGAIPRDNLDARGWHVFFIRDLGGGVGGVYLPEIPAVLQPEIDPFGVAGTDGALPRSWRTSSGTPSAWPTFPAPGTGT